MTVYVEAVILDNFFVTFLIAGLSYRALAITRSHTRQICAAVIGTAVAVFYPLFNIHAAFLILIKLALAAVLSAVLFIKKCKPFKGASVFMGLTFAFGGALFFLGYLFYADAETALKTPLGNLPVGLLIAGGLTAYFFIRRFTARLKRINGAGGYLFKTDFDINGKTYSSTGFLDTGNRLYEPVSGLPVVVVSKKMGLRIFGDDLISFLLLEKPPPGIRGAKFMKFTSASNKTAKLLVIKCDKFTFYDGQTAHIHKEVMLGFSLSDLNDSVEYDLLLHPAIINNEEEINETFTFA